MKKILDYGILTACMVVVILFFAKGISGFGGVIPVEASATTPTPIPTTTGVRMATPTPVPVNYSRPSPTPKAENLVAYYAGTSVLVGEKYDKSKLMVTANFDNGTVKVLEPSEYTVSSELVYKNGLNTVVIMYRDLYTTAYISGRSLSKLIVTPKRYDYGIGNMPDKKDLTVMACYSDNSIEMITEGYKIYPQTLTNLGENEVTVVYGGCEAKCKVYAKNWTSVVAINVTYNKQELFTNELLDKEDFTVMAVYSDLSAERVTTFTLSRNMLYDSGKQPITVTYGGVSKSIELEPIERYVVGIRAEYTGGMVTVGRKINRDNLHVYKRYVDGEEEETDAYTIHNPTINYVGYNTITVYYGELIGEAVVEGTGYVQPDFNYVSTNLATDGKVLVKVETSIPYYLDQDCIKIESLESKALKKAYRKLKLKSGSYMAFDFGFVDENDELELPLPVRITIPDEYDIEHTYLYYCPNQKSVMGRISRKIINSKTFECTMFKAGTYMLVYSKELEGQEE